ncbi:MAG: hypothetical protein AAGC92_05585 [Pseudomonadota bacterium]
MTDQSVAFRTVLDDIWQIGIPNVIDAQPTCRSPLDDIRDADCARDVYGEPPLGFSNDGKTPVFASGTVPMKRDPRGRFG